MGAKEKNGGHGFEENEVVEMEPPNGGLPRISSPHCECSNQHTERTSDGSIKPAKGQPHILIKLFVL